MIDRAHAGHAGEAGMPMMLPHEIMGGVAILVIIGIVLIIMAGIGLRLLLRIDRRLRDGERPGPSMKA